MLHGILEYYKSLKLSGDVRSNQLPFVADPLWSLSAAISYLFIVIYGPQFMEKRKALHLRNVLIGYNFLSVVLSLWMMWEFIACSFLNPKFNLFCEDIDEKDQSPLTIRLMNVHWWYYFSKVIEFLDTFFFILRKKNSQISFLHVYHHASMLLLQWSLVKFVPGGASYFGPMCNCFIHAIMYTYYMLAAMGPHMQKYLWWKKYLTRMQMIQFLAIFLYCSVFLYCSNPSNVVAKALFLVHWFYLLTLLWLFNQFYRISYTPKTKNQADGGFKAESKKDY